MEPVLLSNPKFALLEKIKPKEYIRIFVDSPMESICDDIRFDHQEIGKLPTTFNINDIRQILKLWQFTQPDIVLFA